MVTKDIAYFGRRAAEEDRMASAAVCKAAMDAHLALAAGYRRQIAMLQEISSFV